MAKKRNTKKAKRVESIVHDDAARKNIPTAEYESIMDKEDRSPIQLAYERGNRDLDPQLVWRGKDVKDWSDLVVQAPPLFIQEKVHPKVLIDDLLRHSKEARAEVDGAQVDLFGDFNGIAEGVDKTEFYQHDQNWTNRMILGDSLQVMASLAEREGLRGKVQCIYLDPPYGIKFNSNFQWSTTSRSVKDGKADHITREPEQVKAFRDTWRDGIHSYLTYLRDRLTVARDLLTDSGSIFVQIGDENVHRVRAVMDEVFGEQGFIAIITLQKTGGTSGKFLKSVGDYVLFYGKDTSLTKYRQLFAEKAMGNESNPAKRYDQLQVEVGETRALTRDEKRGFVAISPGARQFQLTDLTSNTGGGKSSEGYLFRGHKYIPPYGRGWSTGEHGRERLDRANRVVSTGSRLMFRRFLDDFPAFALSNIWSDAAITPDMRYVVQTHPTVIRRCVLMTTDPGDLVLDPTCGSGTTATVAEHWGRRWITIDTSRVALALARVRIMGARYPFFLLADSREGQLKEAEVTRSAPSMQPVHGDIRHGFTYERIPHITLKSVANNAEIEVIWEQWQAKLEPRREELNAALEKTWQEWEVPREPDAKWPDAAEKLHTDWWQARIARQHEIDKSISAKAEFEFLYDKPYEDKKTVRVAGPFTVESLSPHRVLDVDENDELVDRAAEPEVLYTTAQDFTSMILENLKTAGVQQAHKEDKISFISLTPWPGDYVAAQGVYEELGPKGPVEKRAAILVGPEFGTVIRADLVEAAREAADSGCDVLVACAFNYDAHATEFDKLGRIPVLKARMNADLHMAADLKNTGKGNLFVIFGEPDIEILGAEDDQIQVKVNGVDVFDPSTGEVRSDDIDGIACWFVDTDYDGESFFVRHAYFLGANDPYKSLKTTLKAEIDREAWETLHSDTSRPFPKPKSKRIAVKVINHLGDEVMKVFRVG